MERRFQISFLCELDARAMLDRAVATGVGPTERDYALVYLLSARAYTESEIRSGLRIPCKKCGNAHHLISTSHAIRLASEGCDYPPLAAMVFGLREEGFKGNAELIEELLSPASPPTVGLRVLKGGKD